MKKYIIKIFIATILLPILGCNDKLDEEIRSVISPEFFATPEGVEYGLNSAYYILRELYGAEDGISGLTVAGTDEFRHNNDAGVVEPVIKYSSSFTPSHNSLNLVWRWCYMGINTCSGVIDYGSSANMNESDKKRILAEARFMRAFYYFKLVQFFGDVTLNKEFQNEPSRSAERNPQKDVYEFIIEDLKKAIEDLPLSPTVGNNGQPANSRTGAITGATARHLLAKVYLTRGYKNFAESTDFENAYKTAKALTDDAESIGIGLLPSYADIFTPGNENNKEVLMNIQYSTDKTYSGGHPLNHFFVARYDEAMKARDFVNGRSFRWYRANPWVFNSAFADKENDTRYWSTFQSVWTVQQSNQTRDSYTYTVKINGVDQSFTTSFPTVGSRAIYMPGHPMTKEEIQAEIDNGGGVVIPSTYYSSETEANSNVLFPTMTKFLDPTRSAWTSDVGENSRRPIMIYRLAETYLIAAEAAIMNNQPALAVPMVNAVRERAAAEGKKTQMQVTSGMMTLDFILDERTRELCAENMRWLDLVRTGKLIERVQKYSTDDAKTNIAPKHVLRPIPQNQIDLVTVGTKYPQNEGWTN
ncbi:hypothetical protein GGR21_000802 [Dysgonomonas hofstadii]|uniref:Starch-binding associating with outer membrane n=1 Tax=Dysgonomonas hofstadii TaxID=637886 RepID=A0A840CPM5_9BACT|nr:RagB/SusD family nutrient uptake outer membrane protein [Dysgonomonas hofstadii]MBB4034915.1 hypothetical protein [Dysgonomonas hofstadii]